MTEQNKIVDPEHILAHLAPGITPLIASLGACNGYDADGAPCIRIENEPQLFVDNFKVTSGILVPVGEKAALCHELGRSLRYLNTELEYAALNNQGAQPATNGRLAQMNGLSGFGAANDFSFPEPNPDNQVTEDLILQMAESMVLPEGKKSMILLAGPWQARKLHDLKWKSRVAKLDMEVLKDVAQRPGVLVIEAPQGMITVMVDRYVAKSEHEGSKYDQLLMYVPAQCSIIYRRDPGYRVTGGGIYQSSLEATLHVSGQKSVARCLYCAE